MALVAAGLVGEARHEVAPGAVRPPQVQAGAAAGALASLVGAVEGGDEELARAVSPDGSLGHLVPNALALGVSDFALRYVDEVGAPGSDGSWLAEVDATWRFDGFDHHPARARVLVRFTTTEQGVVVTQFAGDAAVGRRAPLWMSEAVETARADRTLAVVSASVDHAALRARMLIEEVHRGVATVHATLPSWRGRVVVEQMGSAAALERALGVEPGRYAEIAAVTATVDGSSSARSPVHVYLNPGIFAGMDAADREVVLAHELAHVATGAATSVMETWLLEGFADYVALRDTRAPDEVSLGRAIADVRRNGLPQDLPSDDDFTTAEDPQLAYEQAWLACRVLADRIGSEGVIEVYRLVDDGRGLDQVLVEAGAPRAALMRDWRSALQHVADQG